MKDGVQAIATEYHTAVQTDEEDDANEAIIKLLTLMGMSFHTIQDFYAHRLVS